MSTEHDLQMIDDTLRTHDAVAVTPAGVVVAVGPDVETALRRAARAVTVYVRDPALVPATPHPDRLYKIVVRP